MNDLRTTPEMITDLNANEIFVFGSNLSGIHGAGAARTAMKWGAIYGQGVGLQGKTYAIPSKDADIETMPVADIAPYVDAFLEHARQTPEAKYLVTAIGCGLAGYTPEDIAPLFVAAEHIENVCLPMSFWRVIFAQG